jgi:hypothetical protein
MEFPVTEYPAKPHEFTKTSTKTTVTLQVHDSILTARQIACILLAKEPLPGTILRVRVRQVTTEIAEICNCDD